MNPLQVFAFIPARGGSKRLPGKNIHPFAGHPLLDYSVKLALLEPMICRCLVSTDDPETARLAETFGAEVIWRPEELSGDVSTTASAMVHGLGSLGESERPDALVLLQPNCPLRPRSVIADALALLNDDTDSVVTVTRHHQKTGTIDGTRFVPDYVTGSRSQDQPLRYFENGVAYATWSRVLLEEGSVFGQRIRPLVIDPLYAAGDIDTLLDLRVAECLFAQHPREFAWADEQQAAVS